MALSFLCLPASSCLVAVPCASCPLRMGMSFWVICSSGWSNWSDRMLSLPLDSAVGQFAGIGRGEPVLKRAGLNMNDHPFAPCQEQRFMLAKGEQALPLTAVSWKRVVMASALVRSCFLSTLVAALAATTLPHSSVAKSSGFCVMVTSAR